MKRHNAVTGSNYLGFALLELLVATFVSSMIGMMLTAALFQTTKIQRTVQNLSDASMRVAIFQHQMSRDIAGAFVPLRAIEMPEKKEAPKSVLPPQAPGVGKQEPPQVEAKSEKKDRPKPLKPVFLATQKNGQVDTLTFITNNPASVYSGGPLGQVKPRIARVVYQLKPETSRKDSYILFRQEGYELEFEKYRNAKEGSLRPYELLTGIKSMKVTYITYEKDKQGLQKKIVSEWKHEPKKQEPKQEIKGKELSGKKSDAPEKKEPFMPALVSIALVLWDNEYKYTYSFTFDMPIFVPEPPVQKDEEIDTSVEGKDAPANSPSSGMPLQPEKTIVLNVSLFEGDAYEA